MTQVLKKRSMLQFINFKKLTYYVYILGFKKEYLISRIFIYGQDDLLVEHILELITRFIRMSFSYHLVLRAGFAKEC